MPTLHKTRGKQYRQVHNELCRTYLSLQPRNRSSVSTFRTAGSVHILCKNCIYLRSCYGLARENYKKNASLESCLVQTEEAPIKILLRLGKRTDCIDGIVCSVWDKIVDDLFNQVSNLIPNGEGKNREETFISPQGSTVPLRLNMGNGVTL